MPNSCMCSTRGGSQIDNASMQINSHKNYKYTFDIVGFKIKKIEVTT